MKKIIPVVTSKIVDVTEENKDEIVTSLHALVDECQALIREINNPEVYNGKEV
jgi:hypothetical protein